MVSFKVGRFQTTSLWIRHLEVCLNEHWLPTQNEWFYYKIVLNYKLIDFYQRDIVHVYAMVT